MRRGGRPLNSSRIAYRTTRNWAMMGHLSIGRNVTQSPLNSPIRRSSRTSRQSQANFSIVKPDDFSLRVTERKPNCGQGMRTTPQQWPASCYAYRASAIPYGLATRFPPRAAQSSGSVNPCAAFRGDGASEQAFRAKFEEVGWEAACAWAEEIGHDGHNKAVEQMGVELSRIVERMLDLGPTTLAGIAAVAATLREDALASYWEEPAQNRDWDVELVTRLIDALVVAGPGRPA
jgi:hypothetical protein